MTPHSVRQVVRAKRNLPRIVRISAAVFTAAALLVLSVFAVSLLAARSMMDVPKKPLGSYSSTVMPPFSLAGFKSLDGQTPLTGWLFQPKGESRGTVVMVHSIGKNRLQFDADTLILYEFFISSGYGVLSFDLSHSGESGGEFSTYGYNEWEDVVAAMDYAWRNSVSDNLLLLGWGTGCAACMLALDRIPGPDADRGTILPGDDSTRAEALRSLPFDRGDVRALILDGIASSPDAYIRAELSDRLIDRVLKKRTVPVAIRLSSQYNGETSLIPILSQAQMPVLVIGTDGPDASATAGAAVLLGERMRLHPDSTMTYQPVGAGYLEAFDSDPAGYTARLGDFLRRYADRDSKQG